VNLKEGEMYVVPRGVENRPAAETECQIKLLKPRGVTNTGDGHDMDMKIINDVLI
jgi:mannose-6-phosphate isomerase-like protein (cupin superfamily)